MKQLDPIGAAHAAIATNPTRPATSVIYDTPDARLVVFRLAPGQAVPPHRNASSVHLTVLAGRGILTGESSDGSVEISCAAGDVVVYSSGELHAMRAESEEFLLLAMIGPRPGGRSAAEGGAERRSGASGSA